MKTIIAIAMTGAAAMVLALPSFAQQGTLPTPQDRAENREKVQDALPSAEERAQNREKVQDTLPTPPSAQERAENREAVSSTAAGAALTTKVKSALAADVGLRTVTGIDVDSADGVVTLKGKVASAGAKRRAEQVAKKVDGVRSVKNELRIEAQRKG